MFQFFCVAFWAIAQFIGAAILLYMGGYILISNFRSWRELRAYRRQLQRDQARKRLELALDEYPEVFHPNGRSHADGRSAQEVASRR